MTQVPLETITITDPLADFIAKSERIVITSVAGERTYKVRNEKGEEIEASPVFTEGTVNISYS